MSTPQSSDKARTRELPQKESLHDEDDKATGGAGPADAKGSGARPSDAKGKVGPEGAAKFGAKMAGLAKGKGPSRPVNHKVVSGDTLFAISKHYYGDGTKWEVIMDANPGKVHKGGDLIHVDEILKIPGAGRAEEALGAAGGAGGAVECIDFSTMGEKALADFMTELGSGKRNLDATNRDGLLAHLKAMSAEDFGSLVVVLDKAKTLFAFLQDTYSGETDVQVKDAVIDKEIPVLLWRMWNADDRMDKDVKRANEIYNHEGIGVIPVSKKVIAKADAERVTGKELDDEWKADSSYAGDKGKGEFTNDDFEKLIKSFIPSTVIGGLWVKDFTKANLFGVAGAEFYFKANYPKVAAVSATNARADTFAHELGHILTDASHRNEDAAGADDADALMHKGTGRDTADHGDDRLTDKEIKAIKASAFGWTVDQCKA